jgi:hypothetical protein
MDSATPCGTLLRQPGRWVNQGKLRLEGKHNLTVKVALLLEAGGCCSWQPDELSADLVCPCTK